VLRLENVSVAYGGLRALDNVNLTVGQGEFVAIVGPNGAGKTTLFRAISGIVPLAAGHMHYAEHDLVATAPHARAALGIAHVPEGRQVFASLTVLENLEMGAQTRAARDAWPDTLAFIHTLFPRLAERSKQLAGTLSGGEQQMLSIGRGLASKPRLLLLDEPSMGLAPTVADQIFECIERVHREQGIGILLVEQRVAEALETCDRGYVLESGRIVLEGTHETLMQDSRIKKAYLGL
jgi:branched-chain amino acid transport system ATP-binding protein